MSVDLSDGKEVMTLSLDWNDRVIKDIETHQAIVSASDGKLHLIQLENSGLKLVRSWKAHEYEGWIAAFDYFNPSVVYSGADDCQLIGWDLNSGSKTFRLE